MTKAMTKEVKTNFIYKEIWTNCHRENKNFNLLICGQVGSGKSYAGLEFARQIDPNFEIGNICFSVKELLELMNNNKLKKGSAIIMDESAGSEENVDSRAFMSKENKLMGFIQTTCRALNLFMIFIAPSQNQIDVRVRTIGVGGILAMKKIYREQGYSRADFYWQTFNPKTGKVYTPKPRLTNVKTGERKIVDYVLIQKPPKDLIQKYESKKKQFIQNNLEKWLKQLKDKEQQKDILTKPMSEQIEELKKIVLNEPNKYQTNKGKFSKDIIQYKLNIPNRLAGVIHNELLKV
ncbi:MAG: hypothetical protein PHD05_02480 [Sphaerochaetaceae bacterium]|nr:hypothetical protein [Sphaerochaetaceae bacterium]